MVSLWVRIKESVKITTSFINPKVLQALLVVNYLRWLMPLLLKHPDNLKGERGAGYRGSFMGDQGCIAKVGGACGFAEITPTNSVWDT